METIVAMLRALSMAFAMTWEILCGCSR